MTSGIMEQMSCCKQIRCIKCHSGLICPKCKQFYTTTIIYDYIKLYKQSPELLKHIDKDLRSQMTKSEYHKKYIGYFPYPAYMGDFKQQWDIFTYGLLSDYNWKHTVACGRAIWAISKQQYYDNEHIYLTIYDTDYRIIRQQLQHLFNTLPNNISVALQEGIIIVSIPGMVRKVCIYVDYNKTPFWIIYNPKNYFNTYGTLYHPDMGVQMTVNALVNDKTPSFIELPDLDKVLGYNYIIKPYNKPEFILNHIYMEYRFRIKMSSEQGQELLVKQIRDRINKIVDVDVDIDVDVDSDSDSGSGLSLSLVSTQGILNITPTIMTPNNVYYAVRKVVYIQPMELRSVPAST